MPHAYLKIFRLFENLNSFKMEIVLFLLNEAGNDILVVGFGLVSMVFFFTLWVCEMLMKSKIFSDFILGD